MQPWFNPSRRKRIATLLSTALLFGLAQGLTPLAHTVRALDPGPAEERQNPWPELADQFVLEPFPADYPATGPDGSLPNIISTSQSETALRVALPGDWVTPDYKESTVDYSVAPSGKPAEQAAIGVETVAAGGAPAYSWDGGTNKDGLYLWSYQATPVKGDCPAPSDGSTEPPPPCAPNFDPTPATGGPFPVIIDRQAPAVLGLHPLKDGWAGLEVKDQVSGVQRVEAAIYVAGQEHLASIPQPEVGWGSIPAAPSSGSILRRSLSLTGWSR